MAVNNHARHVSRRILGWYKKNQRDLPWRHTHDPYHILVSEVMLQQTQVDRVVPKYKEFLLKFPTVHALANAATADVIKIWKGLGYNRRALFLQKTARAIVREHQGNFPQDLEQLKELPGIGDYTARAILAFAFRKSIPVLDTNHRRFYQRVFFGLRKKDDKQLLVHAESIVPHKKAWDWNQALMDFGSLVCVTGKPKCETCPVNKFCKAYPRLRLGVPQLRKKGGKIVRFQDTDRYFRGRIMDMLREKEQIPLRHVMKHFPQLSRARFDHIVLQLSKDGLLRTKQRYILLPE